MNRFDQPKAIRRSWMKTMGVLSVAVLALAKPVHSDVFPTKVDTVQLSWNQTASYRSFISGDIGGLQPWNQYVDSGEMTLVCRSILPEAPPELFLLLYTQVAELVARSDTFIGVVDAEESTEIAIGTPPGVSFQTAVNAFPFSWGQVGTSSLVPPSNMLGTRLSPPVLVKVSVDNDFVDPFVNGSLVGLILYDQDAKRAEALLYLEYELNDIGEDFLTDGCV